MTDTTRASLLLRIRDPEDSLAWTEFHDLYAPLLYRYARARGLSGADAEDIRATCYQTIVEKIGAFDYDARRGRFKGWLRTLVDRRVVDLLRKRREKIAETHVLRDAPGDGPTADEAWELEWKRQHLEHCLEAVRSEVSEVQYEAFRLLVKEQVAVTEVARRLDLNANQVYKAKSRVLALVRRRMANLYGEEAEGGEGSP